MMALLMLCVALVGCSGSQGASGSANGSSSAEAEVAPITGKLAIIHTNDVHGYVQAGDGCLGIAAVAALKDDYEAQGYDVLLLDAGDELQGSMLVNDSQGQIAVDYMNAAGYDAMALGNHEFDYGSGVLEDRMASFDFPALAANITVDATGERFADSHVVLELSDGSKVGVFGLDTPTTKTASSPKNTAGLTFASGDDLYAVAQEEIDELRAEGCALVVCLGHLGEDSGCAPSRASDVIANTSGVDLLIDGHDHQVKDTTVTDADGNDVLVVETGCYLANVGVVTYDEGELTETLVAAGDYAGSDETIAQLVDSATADLEARMAEVVATTPFELDGSRYPGNRDRETNLGDLCADAILWEATQAADVAPDAAILNGGGIRTSMEAGDITIGDVRNVFPFDNQLCTIQVTGAQLLEALEAATQDTPDEMGSFPQVAGITYSVDTTVPYERGEQYPDSTYYAPANPGARVTITDVGGRGFSLDDTYTVATIEFIAQGGDTYYGLAEAASTTKVDVGYLDYEALRYYLEEGLGGVVPDRYATPQGRVTLITE